MTPLIDIAINRTTLEPTPTQSNAATNDTRRDRTCFRLTSSHEFPTNTWTGVAHHAKGELSDCDAQQGGAGSAPAHANTRPARHAHQDPRMEPLLVRSRPRRPPHHTTSHHGTTSVESMQLSHISHHMRTVPTALWLVGRPLRASAWVVSKWSCLAAAGDAPRTGQPGWACGHAR